MNLETEITGNVIGDNNRKNTLYGMISTDRRWFGFSIDKLLGKKMPINKTIVVEIIVCRRIMTKPLFMLVGNSSVRMGKHQIAVNVTTHTSDTVAPTRIVPINNEGCFA